MATCQSVLRTAGSLGNLWLATTWKVKMRSFSQAIFRFLAPCIAIGVASLIANSALAVVKSWSTGNGAWASGANWSPAGAPGPADAIFIGPHASAANAQVTLNAAALVASLTLTDGMSLRTSANLLDVNGVTQISGQNVVGPTTFTSRLRVENGVAGTDFRTGDLALSGSGQVALEEDSSVIVLDTATLAESTQLGGYGTVYLGGASSPALINDGRIEATAGGLTLFQTGAGRFDLDGTSGNGQLVATAHDGTGLEINGDQLTDPFSGEIILGPNSRLEMNLTNGWTAGPGSTLVVSGNGNSSPAILEGSSVELRDAISVTGPAARLRIAADAELTSALSANIGDGNELQFFDDTTVSGGTLTTTGAGVVSFLGPSNWQGTVTINGSARVNGMAIVSAATVVNADSFDLDGGAGVTLWDIDAPLTINTEHINSTNNDFDGTLGIGGAAGNQIMVNLADPEQPWQMDGTLNLSGTTDLWRTRIAGSPMHVGGDINIANSNIDIAADVALSASSEVNFSAATSDLRLSGDSHIAAGATFTGQGLLHNNSSGDGMVLADGVSLVEAGLVNGGRLTIGDSEPGQVFVDRFSSESDATLSFWVGGDVPGSELSHLIVTDAAAQVDGTLIPRLVDDGSGLFAPHPDDMFTIITAPGGVVGKFDVLVQPLGLPQGMRFDVIYGANSVTLFMETTFAADFDRDGDVDLADYAIWQDAFGVNNFGDATGDGISDAADYSVWRDQLGSVLPPVVMASAVPEPGDLTLLLLAVAGLSRKSRRAK